MAWGAIGNSLMQGFKSQLDPRTLMQNADQARRSADPGNPANQAVGYRPPAPQAVTPPPGTDAKAGAPAVGETAASLPVGMSPLAQLIAQTLRRPPVQ